MVRAEHLSVLGAAVGLTMIREGDFRAACNVVPSRADWLAMLFGGTHCIRT